MYVYHFSWRVLQHKYVPSLSGGGGARNASSRGGNRGDEPARHTEPHRGRGRSARDSIAVAGESLLVFNIFSNIPRKIRICFDWSILKPRSTDRLAMAVCRYVVYASRFLHECVIYLFYCDLELGRVRSVASIGWIATVGMARFWVIGSVVSCCSRLSSVTCVVRVLNYAQTTWRKCPRFRMCERLRGSIGAESTVSIEY